MKQMCQKIQLGIIITVLFPLHHATLLPMKCE